MCIYAMPFAYVCEYSHICNHIIVRTYKPFYAYTRHICTHKYGDKTSGNSPSPSGGGEGGVGGK